MAVARLRLAALGVLLLGAVACVPWGSAGVGGGAAGTPAWVVGLVGSDDGALPEPVPRDRELSEQQILALVRRAVDLAGGMRSVVPDTARLVLIKPNIAIPVGPETGAVTDPRVVGAVARLVHEVAPHARIRIAEGAGGWQGPAPTPAATMPVLEEVRQVDGFAAAGYRDLVRQLRAAGMDAECLDLNYDDSRRLDVPGGGLVAPYYSLAASIVEADAWINCPVAKTHGPRITAAMKNQVGLLPGRVYGWPKLNGTAEHPGMPHDYHEFDEVLVDLLAVSQPDLNVVEAIVARESGGLWHGDPKRCNWVLAGRNAVAADLVTARLLGYNPDDMEFAAVAAPRGLGPRRLEQVTVRGSAVEQLSTRFRKAVDAYAPDDRWGAIAGYGMGPRYWCLLGPLPLDHRFAPDALQGLAPVPGHDGWSAVTWFDDDAIDLGRHFDLHRPGAIYAFTRFTMARADSVRLWAGSDEGLEVWIDGERVYQHAGARDHMLGQDRLRAHVAAGEHRLLVRATQTRGPFCFSFNICEPLDDPHFAGNRYPGVRYYVEHPE